MRAASSGVSFGDDVAGARVSKRARGGEKAGGARARDVAARRVREVVGDERGDARDCE